LRPIAGNIEWSIAPTAACTIMSASRDVTSIIPCKVRYSHILRQGDLIVYENDSDSLAYRIDATFHGAQTNMAKISVIDPSGIDQSALRTRPDSILLSMGERRNQSGLRDNFILDVGEANDLGSGTILRCTGIDLPDGTAWIELSKNGNGAVQPHPARG
jgi:hypothetical protein